MLVTIKMYVEVFLKWQLQVMYKYIQTLFLRYLSPQLALNNICFYNQSYIVQLKMSVMGNFPIGQLYYQTGLWFWSLFLDHSSLCQQNSSRDGSEPVQWGMRPTVPAMTSLPTWGSATEWRGAWSLIFFLPHLKACVASIWGFSRDTQMSG